MSPLPDRPKRPPRAKDTDRLRVPLLGPAATPGGRLEPSKCRCGHLYSAHNFRGARMQPCSWSSCRCGDYQHASPDFGGACKCGHLHAEPSASSPRPHRCPNPACGCATYRPATPRIEEP